MKLPVFRTTSSTREIESLSPEDVFTLRKLSADYSNFSVGDRVTLLSSDGDWFIADIADIEPELGEIHFDIR